jgi:glucose-6-phosphate dehydrogenase assembly protein OpcA
MAAPDTTANTTTTPSTDAFLSGEGVPVDLHDIETELNRLWGPAAERAGGPVPENPNVTRIVLANLVVCGRPADAGQLREALEVVTTQFPCRTIVVRRTDEPGRAVAAEVSALCHLPAPGLPQVCSERIVLRAGPQAVDLLPGAIRPLLEANLPFVLWWTDDPRRDEALFRDLGDECSRLILDLADPGTTPDALRLGLDPSITRFGRDTAWCGLTRWRELVAQIFDPPCHHETLARLDSVTIEALAPAGAVVDAPGDVPAPPRLALWLAAWLAGQLGWAPRGRPERAPGRLQATFEGPTGPVAVTITSRDDPGITFAQIRGVTLTTRDGGGQDQNQDQAGSTFKLRRVAPGSPQVRVEIDARDYCTLPRMVLAPEIDPPRRVAAALESSRHDPPFQNALPHLFWLLEG